MNHDALSNTPVALFDEDQDMVLDVLCKDGFGPLLRGNTGKTAVDTGGWARMFHAVHSPPAAAPDSITPGVVKSASGQSVHCDAVSTDNDDEADGSASADWSGSTTDRVLKATVRAVAPDVVAANSIADHNKLAVPARGEHAFKFYGGGEAHDLGTFPRDLQLDLHDDQLAILLAGRWSADVIHGGGGDDALLGNRLFAGSGDDQVRAGADASDPQTGHGTNFGVGGHIVWIACVDGVSDHQRGGDGSDRASFYDAVNDFMLVGDDRVRANNSGTDVLHGGSGYDALVGENLSVRLMGEQTRDMFILACKSMHDTVEDFADLADASGRSADDNWVPAVFLLDLDMGLDELQGSVPRGCVLHWYDAASHHVDLHLTCNLMPLLDHNRSVSNRAVHDGWTIIGAPHHALEKTGHSYPASARHLADIMRATQVHGATGRGKSALLNQVILQWVRRVAAAQSDFTRSDADTEHSNVIRDVTNDNAVDLMSVLRSVMHAAKSHN